MQIPHFLQSLCVFFQCLLLAKTDSASLVPLLSFNPVKLLLLVGWVYSCLFLVQRVQFSPLVPKQYKSIAYIITLVAGPAFFLVLVMVHTFKAAGRGDQNILKILKQQLRNAISSVQLARIGVGKEDDTLKLLDSSGRSISEIYGHGESKRQDSHILDLTEQIVAEALEQRASDILIDPTDDARHTVRFRIDGVLRTAREVQSDICKAVINSIKAVSSMDISEKRRPQDGAFLAKKGKTTASFRVASAGVVNGEKLSIRVLSQEAAKFTLADMGLTPKQYSILKNAVDKPSGMILMCGPTGSGKTTTMYSMLNEIDQLTRNVITVEDPIEAVLPTVSQIEINPKAEITFAKTLRSVLRQDPDVICVGEIRDEESAEIALRASQTGHLVLATLHCYSNTAALVRLLDLQISPLLLSSGLSLLVSQRLLRKLCEYCKKPAQPTARQLKEFERKGIDCTNIFDAQGCRKCDKTGYSGRTAVFSLLAMSDKLKADMTDSGALIAELRDEGKKRDKSSLRKEGLKKVVAGVTSMEELKRVIG